MSSDKDLLSLREELLESHKIAAELKHRLEIETTRRLKEEDRANRLSEHIIALRKTISWRLTRPLRAILRFVR